MGKSKDYLSGPTLTEMTDAIQVEREKKAAMIVGVQSSTMSTPLPGLAALQASLLTSSGISVGSSTSSQPVKQEGTSQDMSTEQTKLRRSQGDSVRVCDLAVGDKLWFIAAGGSNVAGVVKEVDATHIGMLWSDQIDLAGEKTPHEQLEEDNTSSLSPSWIAERSSTTMIKNWVSHGQVVFDTSLNQVDVTAPSVAKKGVDFDSVILHDDKKRQILDAISQVDNHQLIFEKWGFGEIFEKGTAISLLFYGPPGTGKTLMAQAIADKFGYKLQMISTAEIETPEPGGAERNLKKYFAEAQAANTVLLFDECDSLVSDRKHVGMILAAQINALLSELERFKGIAIFTTNRLETLDPAFDRRLSLKLEFPMPDKKHRIAIWKRMFPTKAPLADDIRWEDLGSIRIAGGHIKNVVLKTARMAAAQKAETITDQMIWECLEKEVESMEHYQEAINSNPQFYGTPINQKDQQMIRERGKRMLRG